MRIAYTTVAPEAYGAVKPLVQYIDSQSSIEQPLRHLVEMRASQINGCAYCLSLHAKQLRAHGESQVRLDVLPAWEETELFSERERAALAWTESVTLVSETHVPDEVYAQARKEFSEKELVDLTLIVATMNLWNRIAISTRQAPLAESKAH